MQDNFRTLVKIPAPGFKITYADSLLTVGSCFSEHIGNQFADQKFESCINPFGQQYNPASIANALHRLVTVQPYTAADLIFHNEQYHSFDHHSSFSDNTPEKTLNTINHALEQASVVVRKARVLFLTPGTSHVFRLKENGRIVSNCHKLPGAKFDSALLKPEIIVAQWRAAIEALWRINPALKIVFSVSPVRYFAFGHYENSVSKAHLFTAIHALREMYPAIYYFPAYEMVIDDLRDYRFYQADMLHPSSTAIQYVWQAIKQHMIEETLWPVMEEVQRIRLAVNHRPRNPQSEAHKNFVAHTLLQIEKLEQTYSLNFSRERKLLDAFC